MARRRSERLWRAALTDEDIVDALAQEIAGSSRIRRQKAASTVALIADKDASVLLPFADDIASGLTKPEAQTRWEVLHALDQMGKAGQRYEEDVLVAAEDSLYDETNGFVREAAFHFFCGYGSASTDNSEEVWTQIDEAIQCYHGNPEFTDMLTQLVAFAEGNISLATSSALAQRHEVRFRERVGNPAHAFRANRRRPQESSRTGEVACRNETNVAGALLSHSLRDASVFSHLHGMQVEHLREPAGIVADAAWRAAFPGDVEEQ